VLFRSNYTEKKKIEIKIIENYRAIIAKGNTKFANELGSSLSDMAKFQLFDKHFSDAVLYAMEALHPKEDINKDEYNLATENANIYLTLALLYQGKYEDALRIYTPLKDKFIDGISYRVAYENELDALEKKGIKHPDSKKLRELLKK
jgi:hypothetical protein